MICPGVMLFKKSTLRNISSQSFTLTNKASRDGIVAFKRPISYPIVYLGIKGTHIPTGTEILYTPTEIVTFQGHLSRTRAAFLISVGVLIIGIIVFVLWLFTRKKIGYLAINSHERTRSIFPKTQPK